MKRSIIAFLFVSCFGLNAFAADVHVDSVWSQRKVDFFYGSSHEMYSCDYVTDQASAILERMGARDVKIYCSGGLPYETMVSATIHFAAAIPVAELGDVRGLPIEPAMWNAASFSGYESCEFNDELIQNISAAVKTRAMKHSSNCWYSQGSYNFSLEVLK